MEPNKEISTPPIRFDENKGINYQDYNPNYPNKYNAAESERLLIKHKIFEGLFQGNYSAPVDDILSKGGAKVLDAGIGEGSWIFAMSKQFTNAEFIGTDIVPVPEDLLLKDKPKNVQFVQCDTLKGLPFDDNYFDYVHQKFLNGAFLLNDWPIAIKELTRVIKPGGFLEIEEGNFLLFDGGPTWNNWLNSADSLFKDKGVEFLSISTKLPEFLNSVEQLNVHQEVRYLQIGNSKGELEKMGLKWVVETVKSSGPHVSEKMKITSHEDFQKVFDKIVEELENNEKDAKYAMYRYIAQKVLKNH